MTESSGTRCRPDRICFQIVSNNKIAVATKNSAIIEQLKSSIGSSYDPTLKSWVLPIDQYNNILQKIQNYQNSNLEIKSIPKQVLESLNNARKIREQEKIIDLSDIPNDLLTNLLPFQMRGVGFALQFDGNCMICDEMGLGKTLQGIAIACAFKSKWPLLVIVPSSLKQNWKKEFIKWLPDQQQHSINVIETSKNIKISDINIISYDLVSNVIDVLTKAKFKVVIADESHYIKSISSQRSQAVVPLIKSAQHRILLSGTPALSRPAELWPQLEAVGVPIFSSFHQFGLRYCAAWHGPQGWDYSGSSNLSELHTILNEAVMIRRLKDEVLTELPKKERKTVNIEPDSEIAVKIKSKISHYKQIDLQDNKTKALMAETFMLTGQAKIKGVIKYIIGLLKEDLKAKLIVFAHHVEVLENIQSYLQEQYIPFIKIDGSVDQSLRQTLVDRYQQPTLDSPKVALMSLTCGSFGFTMTAASRVIFTELWWTPGLLLQAEDRAHRIGRKDNSPVKIDYCLAKGTMDDLMWPLLSKKLSIIGQALNGEQTRMEIKSDQKLLTPKDRNSAKLSPIFKKEVKASATANKNPKKSAVKKAIQTKSTINRRNTLDNYFQKKAENKENQSDNITNYPKSGDRRQSIGKPNKEPIAFVYRDPCALFRQARPTTQTHNNKTQTSTVSDKLPDSIVLNDSIDDDEEKEEANDKQSFRSSLKRQLDSQSDKPQLKRRKLVQQGLNQQNNNGLDTNQQQYDLNDGIDPYGLSDFQLF